MNHRILVLWRHDIEHEFFPGIQDPADAGFPGVHVHDQEDLRGIVFGVITQADCFDGSVPDLIFLADRAELTPGKPKKQARRVEKFFCIPLSGRKIVCGIDFEYRQSGRKPGGMNTE